MPSPKARKTAQFDPIATRRVFPLFDVPSAPPENVRRTTRLALDTVNVLPQGNATLGHKTGRRCIRARQSLNRGSVRKLSHSGATAR